MQLIVDANANTFDVIFGGVFGRHRYIEQSEHGCCHSRCHSVVSSVWRRLRIERLDGGVTVEIAGNSVTVVIIIVVLVDVVHVVVFVDVVVIAVVSVHTMVRERYIVGARSVQIGYQIQPERKSVSSIVVFQLGLVVYSKKTFSMNS